MKQAAGAIEGGAREFLFWEFSQVYKPKLGIKVKTRAQVMFASFLESENYRFKQKHGGLQNTGELDG